MSREELAEVAGLPSDCEAVLDPERPFFSADSIDAWRELLKP
ncbi:hypothetical protein [Rhodococcus sovatensis]|uniref:Uncharacterized protein n=1 Tax=Rhodococcus sovatensis TaxID=1805840 RepID=A0ABZ2PLZ7_9NOCA